MSTIMLKQYFDKWLEMTPQQRDFISVLVTSQKFTLAQVDALIDEWDLERNPVEEVPE